MSSYLDAIADLSSLTRIQVETLKMHQEVLRDEIKMDVALKMRKNEGISRGTHYRILAQARRNITQSLFTVAAAMQMGLLRAEDVQKLISSVAMIPADLDEEKLPEVIALVKALGDRIVMS